MTCVHAITCITCMWYLDHLQYLPSGYSCRPARTTSEHARSFYAFQSLCIVDSMQASLCTGTCLKCPLGLCRQTYNPKKLACLVLTDLLPKE